MTYRVAYLDRGRKALTGAFSTIERAAKVMRYYKARGWTAWVEEEGGAFVPVPGATRRPNSAP